MEIIKKKKLKQLKACRRACKEIYDLMTSTNEDEHGNVTAYRWDKVHKDIMEILKEAGYGNEHHKIVGMDDWDYPLPWAVERRKA